jgi:hypothetical protein
MTVDHCLPSPEIPPRLSLTSTRKLSIRISDSTVPVGPRPTSVLQAVANIAKYPWLNVATLFQLWFNPPVSAPALAQDQPLDAWTLFLKFTGSFSSIQDENNLLNSPGAFAIDRKGFLWVNDNYISTAKCR